MRLKDWLETTFATHPHSNRRRGRDRNSGFAVAAEILQVRAAPSESVVALAFGSALIGLGQSLDEASAATVEEESQSFQNTFIVRSDDPKVSEISTYETGSSGATSPPPTISADSARAEILPAVLDELFSSSLNESIDFAEPSTILPELPVRDISETNSSRASFVPASNSNTGSPAPTGGGETASFGSGTLSSAGLAQSVQTAKQPAGPETEPIGTTGEPIGTTGGEQSLNLMSGGECDPATNNPPEVNYDGFTDNMVTVEDSAVSLNVIANDRDPDQNVIFITNVTQGNNGAKVTFTNDTVTYTPQENWSGSDEFD